MPRAIIDGKQVEPLGHAVLGEEPIDILGVDELALNERLVGAIANGGVAVEPSILAGKSNGQTRIMKASTAERLSEMMSYNVEYNYGAGNYPGLEMHAKTGTAEFCDWVSDDETGYCRRDREGNFLTHAWFVAFAPADEPQIVLSVFIDGSGLDRIIEGAREAAPVAAEVLRAWFKLPEPAPTADSDPDAQPSAEGDA